MKAWQRAIEMEDEPATHGYYSDLLIRAGRTEEALRHLGIARKRSPQDPYSQHWLTYEGVARLVDGDYPAARDAAMQSLRLGTNGPYNELANAYTLLAASQAFLGKSAEAREAFAAALELRPELSAVCWDVFMRVHRPEFRERYFDALGRAGLE